MAIKKDKDNYMDFSQYRPKYYDQKLKTGIIVMDFMMGGGFTPGSLIEISSQSQAGKSMMCLHMAQNFIKDGKKVLYIDSEGGMEQDTLKNFYLNKLDSNIFELIQLKEFTELERALNSVVDKKNKYDIVIVDSVAGFGANSDNLVTDKQKIGYVATTLSALLKKMKIELRRSGVSMILVNQLRMKPDMRNGVVTSDSVGGNAIQYYPDIRFRMRTVSKVMREEKTVFGSEKIPYMFENLIWCVKSRVQRSGIKLPIHIVLGYGVSNVYTIVEILKRNGLVKTSSNGNCKINLFNGELSFRSTEKFAVYVRDNLDKIVDYLQTNGIWDMLPQDMSDVNDEQILEDDSLSSEDNYQPDESDFEEKDSN